MTWLTWRQFRTHTWIALGAVAALAVALGLVGAHVADLYRQSGLATCTGGTCKDLADAFLLRARAGAGGPLRELGVVLAYLTPGLIGAFWGAPLVGRELETGTFRLAWTQSVSRERWLAVKVGLLGLATLVISGAVALVVTWSSARVDRVEAVRMDPTQFGSHGIVPVAYALLAFAVGVLAGILLRRTVPAMAVTIAYVAVVQVAMPLWVRSHLIAPMTLTRALVATDGTRISLSKDGHIWVQADQNLPGAWVLSNTTVTSAGKPFDVVADPASCSRSVPVDRCLDWLNQQHLQSVVRYQPLSRFWALQWIEAGIVVAAAVVVVGLCFWAVRRRVA